MLNVNTYVEAAASTPRPPYAVERRLVLLGIWLVASLIAVFFALVLRDSTIVGNVYIPRGNDSFYHARRILDAATGRGFYQFDPRLHAPDGAWIPWPWGYDYLMAKATQLALWLKPSLDPVMFICYVPVAWIFVNAGLFLAATGAVRLSLGMRAVAMLCFALSPLTQLLHAIGMVDHHYVEHTFVLLNLWLGLRWFERRDDASRAIALGVALGAAPAFQNGLFVLQTIPLACVFLLWLRKQAPSARALTSFGIALLVVTQIILLPSEPYRRGMFEFGLLSWFHFYVALCTGVVMIAMGRLTYSRKNLGLLLGLAALLAAPLAAQVWSAAGFLSGKFSILDQIVEVQSPYRLFVDVFGPMQTVSYYSWLLLLAPVLLAFYAYRTLREVEPQRLFYAVAVTFGLAMLLDQFRFYYFGFFGLVTGSLLLVDRLRAHFRWHGGATLVATLAAIVLAYQPALRHRLFFVYAVGEEVEYASAFALFLDLGKLCAEDPGTVLASNDDGNAILYHTQCSVIANNFVLRPEDAAKIDETRRLMQLSPEELRVRRPDIKYLLLRARDFSVIENGRPVIANGNRMAKELLVDEHPPPGYTLIKTVNRRLGRDGIAHLYARLYKVTPVATVAGP